MTNVADSGESGDGFGRTLETGDFNRDGKVNAQEACDDRNMVDTDLCTAACTAAACGDGLHGRAGGATLPHARMSGASALRGFYTSGMILFRPDEGQSARELQRLLGQRPVEPSELGEQLSLF